MPKFSIFNLQFHKHYFGVSTPKFSVTMVDKWHFKRQNKGILNIKSGILNAKKWCVECQFRHFKRLNLYMKLTPRKEVNDRPQRWTVTNLKNRDTLAYQDF